MHVNHKRSIVLAVVAIIGLTGTGIGFAANSIMGSQQLESRVYELYTPKEGDDELIATVGDYQIFRGAVYRALEFDKLAGLETNANDTIGSTLDGLITTAVAVAEAERLGMVVTIEEAQSAVNGLRESCTRPDHPCREWVEGMLAAGVVQSEEELWSHVVQSRRRSMTYTRMFNHAASGTLGPDATIDDLNAFREQWTDDLRGRIEIEWHDDDSRVSYLDWLQRRSG